MFRSRILPALMAAMIALGGGGVAFASSGEHENAGEIAAVTGAKVSVAQAIAAAEQKSGGRAIKIEMEKKSGAYLYEIKTISKDKVSKIFIDPASGKVVRTDDEGLFDKLFDREDRREFGKLTAAPTTLAAAIATAEQNVGGKAIEARFTDKDDKVVVKIEVVTTDNAVHRVLVDSASGKVIKVVSKHED